MVNKYVKTQELSWNVYVLFLSFFIFFHYDVRENLTGHVGHYSAAGSE